MELLQKAELWCASIFSRKDVPQMPEDARKGVAGALWIVALCAGVLQLWTTWLLWEAGHVLYSNTLDATRQFAVNYGYVPAMPHLGLMYYLSIIIAAATAVLLLLAAPNLKARKKQGGWDLLFYATFAYVLYGLVRSFAGGYGHIFDLLISVVVAGFSLYLLFQVRSQFMASPMKHVPEHKTDHKAEKDEADSKAAGAEEKDDKDDKKK